MEDNNKNYEILYRKYTDLLDSPSYQATKPIRIFVDNIKHLFNPNKPLKRSNFSDGSFGALLEEYNSILNSNTWILTKPFRFFEKKRNKENDIDDTVKNDFDTVIGNPSYEFQDLEYEKWIEVYEKDEGYINFEYNPLISIIVPVYNVKEIYLKECVNSVLQQKYKNYELILVDDKSTNKDTIKYLTSLENNKKIRVIYRKENGGISEATNTGLENAKGIFVGLLDDDDILSKNALYEVVKSLNDNSNLDLIYSDEDKIDPSGKYRFFPQFKPDYSPELLLNNNYICHFLVFRKTLSDIVGKFDKSFDGAQDFDYILRLVEKTNCDRIYHISKVLYHWRAIPGSTSLSINAKPHVLERTLNAKQNAIQRRELNAYVENDGNVYYSDDKAISIIILSKDNFSILKKCIDSINSKSSYKNYEIIVVDNGSCEKNRKLVENYLNTMHNCTYVYSKMEFNFSVLSNIGAEKANNDVLLFLNDDIEIVDDSILKRMVGYATLDYVGAVGTKLLYTNTTIIQHCGILSAFPGPTHYLQGLDDSLIHHNHFNRRVEDVVAVTGACFMIEKSKFNKAGKFNIEFSDNYNDVELCFALYKKGYINVCLNNVYSYHYERYSRKEEYNTKKVLREVKKLYDLYPEMFMHDPYYSDSYRLSSQDFSI